MYIGNYIQLVKSAVCLASDGLEAVLRLRNAHPQRKGASVAAVKTSALELRVNVKALVTPISAHKDNRCICA